MELLFSVKFFLFHTRKIIYHSSSMSASTNCKRTRCSI